MEHQILMIGYYLLQFKNIILFYTKKIDVLLQNIGRNKSYLINPEHEINYIGEIKYQIKMQVRAHSTARAKDTKKVILLGPNRKQLSHQVSKFIPRDNISVFTRVRPQGVDVNFNYSIKSREEELGIGQTLDLEISALSRQLAYKKKLFQQMKVQNQLEENTTQKARKNSVENHENKSFLEELLEDSFQRNKEQNSKILIESKKLNSKFSYPLEKLDLKIMQMMNLFHKND